MPSQLEHRFLTLTDDDVKALLRSRIQTVEAELLGVKIREIENGDPEPAVIAGITTRIDRLIALLHDLSHPTGATP